MNFGVFFCFFYYFFQLTLRSGVQHLCQAHSGCAGVDILGSILSFWGKALKISLNTAMNEELIASAVSFLKDDNVASSPINKKIEFLQSKGLNEQEIEEAIKRSNASPDTAPAQSPHKPMTYREATQGSHNLAPLDYYTVAPPTPERTWKDYFIMATATAGVTYGLYQVVSRYLLPSIIPPGKSRLDDDKQAIENEFIKIDKVLEQMSLEQKEMKEANERKLEEIDVVIGNINDFLSKYNKDKLKFDDDLRLMKLEVDNLQNTVEKNMKLTKENIHDELTDISDELESLKSLIKARSGFTASSERKVKPVSSIPSASEILKRAKSNDNGATEKSEHAPETPSSTRANSVSHENLPSSSSSISEKKLAAGIPDWQLAHKEREERETSTASVSENSSNAIKGDDDVVNASIQNVGVPQWQLNASS